MSRTMGGAVTGSPHRHFGRLRSWDGWGSPWLHSALVFAAAFLLRAAFLSEILSHPLLDINQVPGTDMEAYLGWARRIAAGNWLGRGEGPFYQGPAFPYLLALIFQLFGPGLFPAMLVQALLGSGSAVLVYWLGRRLADARVGLAAGLLAAGYKFLIFFGVILHSTTLEFFLACGAFLAVAVAGARGGGWWGAAGVVTALAALARPNFLVVPAFVAAGILLRDWGRWREVGRAVACLALGFVLVVAPVTLRNLVVGGKLVLLTSAGPETFRIANSYDSTPLNFRYPRQPQMPLDSGAFWRHQAVKAALFWWGFEAPQNVNYYLFRTVSSVLALPLVTYWMLVPLAAAGLWGVRRRWRELAPLLLFGAGYYLSVVAFHIVGRFRLPLLPLLLLLGAGALVRGWELWRARRFGPLAAGAALVAGLTALAYPWGFPLIYPVDHANTGYILANRGDLEGGLRELAVAEAGLPGTLHLNYDMGRMLLLLGRPDQALARFERELRLAPRHAEALRRAGVAAKAAGDLERAARHWEQYLSLAPRGERADEVRRQLQALPDRQSRMR
jgi:4-amino-4-deoxy-L-arabinose transferase-like glycosyltransferase